MATHAGVALELGIIRPAEGKSRSVVGHKKVNSRSGVGQEQVSSRARIGQ